MSIVTGLTTALEEKATVGHVNEIASRLNKEVAAHENRIAALEGRLTWQPLTDNEQ